MIWLADKVRLDQVEARGSWQGVRDMFGIVPLSAG
jgi:hypothetical protein